MVGFEPMQSRMRPAMVALCATALVVVSACSDQQVGSASPELTPSNASQSVRPSSPGTDVDTPTNGAPTASLDPCSLLSPEELTELAPKYSDGEQSPWGDERTCQWVPQIPDASTRLPIVGVYIWDNQGVDQLKPVEGGSEIKYGTLGQRKVAKAPGPDGCLIALAVGDAARVDVVVSNLEGSSEQEFCQTTEKVVEIVEPKLPEG